MTQTTALEFSHAETPKLGVLLTNLGTPDAPTPSALRRYLAEFLWDPRVVDLPRPLWWIILHGIILRTRPARSAKAYQSVWTGDGSPLLQIAKIQTEGVRARLQQRYKAPVEVVLGMRYGNPSIASALAQLRAANVQRLLVLPLYPQYSCSTTASTFDAVAQAYTKQRWLPETRFINHYHDQKGYIEALANSLRDQWQRQEPGEKLIFSFHGTPKRFLEEGDPYYCECQKTARLVAESLELPDERWQVCFQSRFGREEWLQPYTDVTLQQLAKDGVNNVDVICPGFSADCLETIEEIGEENRDNFLHAGGEQFNYIPALNDRDDHLDALADLIIQHTRGWPESEADYVVDAAEDKLRQQRAKALGAKN